MSEMPDQSLRAKLRKAPGYLWKQFNRALVRRRLDRYFSQHPEHPALSSEAALEAAQRAESVLFLCWGNVCRSPLAERYLRAELQARDVEGIEVWSAGLGKYEGRPSPRDAVAVASQYGIDLSDHRSRRTSPRLVEASDVVFVMDYNNYHDLVSRVPEAEERTFFLGALLRNGDAIIGDPHGRGRPVFERVYAEVTAAVDELATAVAGEADETAEADEAV